MSKKKDNENPLKFYAKYSSLGLQMIVIIVGAAFGGREIDKHTKWEFPVFTVSLTIFGAVVAIVYGMREIFKQK
jgi:hypothetical protein